MILCFLLLHPLPAVAQRVPFGPFETRDEFPVKLLFLSLRPDRAGLRPPGTLRLAGRFAYANTYAVTRPVGNPTVPLDYYQAAPLSEYRLFVDAEVLRASFDIDWSPSARWQLGAEVPFLIQGGGYLDRTVEGFHHLFRLSNGGREQTPRNAYGVFVVRSGRFWIAHDQPPAAGLGDVVLRVKTAVITPHGRRPALSWLGALKLPTGQFDRLTGSGGTDAQVALLLTQPIGASFILHYNVGYTHIGRPARSAGFPVRSITSHLLAAEYLATRRLSVILQALANTSLFPAGRLGPLDRTAYELHAGVKYALTPSILLDIGLMENLSQYQ
ncbi:MAG: DUF3187 family protein, partial [Candidatus Latescibacteria bacterium]|nr:DUF3187 family protein [Candidatus Latescibacterota bacterium]